MPSDLVNLAYDQHGRAERYRKYTLYWQEETYLTYNKTIGEHRINAMAGLSNRDASMTILGCIRKTSLAISLKTLIWMLVRSPMLRKLIGNVGL